MSTAVMESQTLPALRILLVEDNPADVRLVRALLNAAARAHREGGVGQPPPELDHVTRLQDAVDRLGAAAFDAVLLDLSLPDADGLQAVTRLRAVAPTV